MKRAAAVILPLALLVGAAIVLSRARTPDGARGGHNGDGGHSGPSTTSSTAPHDHANAPVPKGAGSIRVLVLGGAVPLADARVAILQEPSHKATEQTTNASGACLFEGVAPGDWTVGARHRRFVVTAERTTVADGVASEVTLRLVEGGVASGVVTDTTGAALPGASVVILDAEKRIQLQHGLEARTDTLGQYRIEGIPVKRVGIAARAPKYRPVERLDLEWSRPGEEQAHHFALELGTVVTGRVIDESGSGVPDAVVTAGAAGDLAGSTRTDREGRFIIEGLGDKPLGMSAGARGFGTVYLRGVPAGAQNVELRVLRGGRIEGRANPPIDTFSVLLNRYEPDLGRELRVMTWPCRGARGEFSIVDVAKGEYELEIDAPGYETVARVKVVVHAGQTLTGVVIQLQPK